MTDVDELTASEVRALKALSEYGPDTYVPVTVIAQRHDVDPAMMGRVFGRLNKKCWVQRQEKHGVFSYRVLRLPPGMNFPARPLPAPVLMPVDNLSVAQKQALKFLLKQAGDQGSTMRDIRLALKVRPGPLARTLFLLVRYGYLHIRNAEHAHYIAIRDAAGKPIERFPAGTRIEYRAGQRVIIYPPRPARGYGEFISAVTIRSRIP